MKRRILLIVILLLLTIITNATVYYVNGTTGSDLPGNGTSTNPWKTITYALSQISGSGHTVYVAEGTYNSVSGETFPITMKNAISLSGAGEATTIIDAEGTQRVINCIGITDPSTFIEGFKITGGLLGDNNTEGGGLYISSGSALTIRNNTISGNSVDAWGKGGGIFISNSSPHIINNTISGNSAYPFGDGNAIAIYNSTPLIESNKIINNTNTQSYNCIYVYGSSSSPRIINNVIAKNSAHAINCSAGTPTIINNTISDNKGYGIIIYSAVPDSIFNNIISFNSGYGIYEINSSYDPGKVWYNLFYANDDGSYYDEGATGYYTAASLNTNVAECKNNIDGDPIFVDKVNNDYHLQKYSHAIDAGDPSFAYSNEPFPNGSRINAGAYGNTSEATISIEPPVLPVDLYVDASSGSNTTGDGNSGSPWKTITYALSQILGSGHTVHVAAGIYNTTLGETFPIVMKNGVSLTGAGEANTILEAGGANRVLDCIGITDPSTFIEGFKITGGVLGDNYSQGGGLYISAGSVLTVRNNTISGNSVDAWGSGGGIFISYSSPRIINNTISDNSAYPFGYGNAIAIYSSTPQIDRNIIINNTNTQSYNCIYIYGSLCSPRIINNVIAKNSAIAINCSAGTPTIINNTISDNIGYGIYIGSAVPDSIFNNIISNNSGYGIYESGTSYDPGKVWYNLFFANESGLYYDEMSTDYYTAGSLNASVSECKNNIDGDPMFVDKVNNDYHLRSNSPAIDAGDPNSPLDPDGSHADIGAYHYIMPPPDAPVANSPTFIGLTDLILNWNNSATATGYLVDMTTDAGFSTFVSGFENRDVLNVTSYSVTGLTANTNYYYRIRAYNNSGTSPNSNEISVITLLSPPVAPSAPVSDSPSNISQTTFVANWGSVSTATSYRLDVATDNTFTSFVAGYSDFEILNATSFQVTGLVANTEYFYRVRACNSGGQSVNSNTVSATTLPDPPLAPEGVNYSDVTQTSFAAYWNSSATATGYFLDVATDDIFTTFVSGYNNKDVANVTTTPVTGLTAYTNYYFRIRAYNISGTSPSGSVVSILTLQIPAPEAPTALSESNKTQTSFYANWNASATATGYFLDVATDDAFMSFVPGYNNKTLANVITSQVSGLSPNTPYYYRVRAFNAGGTSPSSNTITLTTLQILPPAAPAVIDASSVTQTGFTANWSTSATATGYILDVAGDAAFTDWIAGAAYANLDVSNVTSYDITGLSPNTTYYYRLSAYNAGGQSSYSIVIPVITPDYPPVAPTANEATNNGLRNFTANWNSLSNANGYYLDIATNSSFTTFVTGYDNKDVLNTLNWNVTDLTPGTEYYYRVRAYNTGGTSGNSNTITANTLQIPVTEHYVDVSTGDNSTGDGTAAKPWKTITYALESISGTGRHKIHVAAGNYNATSGELFPIMPGDSISLIGSGKNVTIIDAGSNNTVIKYAGVLDPQVTIEGFSITGGKSTVSNNAGGIYISGGSVLTVSDNIITANRAEESASGGAIYVSNSSPTIVKNVISLNHGQIINNGASIFINGSASAPLITENTIMDNINDIIAGGIVGAGTLVISGSSGAIVINNVFTNNNPGGGYSNSKDGGDIYIVNCSPTIKYNLITKSKGNGIYIYNTASSPSIINNTISDNTYDGIYLYSAKPDSVFNNIISFNSGYGINEYTTASDPARVEYNLFYQNSLGLYYDEGNNAFSSVATLNSTVTECKNNIAGNPLFVDKLNNKYGLKAGSAAIDAGDPASPLDPNGTRADIGAYYYVPLPAAPVADAATYLGTTDFTANWNSSATATGYYLDVATEIGFSSFVAGYNNRDVSDVTSFNVAGLTANIPYYYRVRAYNSGGTSSSSNTISVTTLLNPPSPPSAPVCITESSVTQTSFTANWNSSATATGYYLDVSINNAFLSFVAGYNNRDVSDITSFNVAGLTANSTYYYRVRAYNSGGTSGNSNTISVTTLLNPPSPPSAPVCITESNVTQTSFTANWNSSATATGYYLDVATDNGFTLFVAGYNNRDVSDVTSFNVTGLTANATYYYRVRAYNSGGTSSSSNTISVTTLLNPPAPPSAPVCVTESSLTQTSFTANWNSSATATGYYLDVATDNAFTSFSTYLSGYYNKDIGLATNASVTGLSARANYFYRVRAYNGSGTSGNSNIIPVTTLPNPPAAPTGLTASSCNNNVTLTWNAISESDFLRYRIYGGTTSDPTEQIDSTGNQITETTKTINGLTNGETYYFRITAVLSPLVEGDFSSSASVKVKTGVIPKIKVKWNNVLISYNHGDSITGYQWYNGITAIDNATEQYYVTNKLPGSYHVLTIDKNGCRNTSNIITISNTKSLSIFPNPAETSFTLSLVSETIGKAAVSLYNATGIKVLEYQTEKPDRLLYTEIPVENLQSGTYILELIVDNEEITYSRVVILK